MVGFERWKKNFFIYHLDLFFSGHGGKDPVSPDPSVVLTLRNRIRLGVRRGLWVAFLSPSRRLESWSSTCRVPTVHTRYRFLQKAVRTTNTLHTTPVLVVYLSSHTVHTRCRFLGYRTSNLESSTEPPGFRIFYPTKDNVDHGVESWLCVRGPYLSHYLLGIVVLIQRRYIYLTPEFCL